jgi:hypothetical protein
MFCTGPFVSNNCQGCRGRKNENCHIQIAVEKLEEQKKIMSLECVDCPRKKTLLLLR